MKMNTYVNFAGKCAEACHYYEKHLGAKIGMMMTHGQGPDAGRWSPEWREAVLHARIHIAGTELMAAEPMRSAYLSLGMDSDSEAERVFAALSDGGQVSDAYAGDLLCLPFWPGTGPVRHQLDDRPRTPDAGGFLESLSPHTGLSSGATTAMVDRLERAGLIGRQPDPMDRRGTILVLTDRWALH